MFLSLFAGSIVLLATSMVWAADAPGGPETTPVADGIDFDQSDWPWWRGLHRNGTAAPGQQPPLSWGESKNVLWQVPVPGRGHATPTVVGDHIYLPTADEQAEIQSVLCYDRQSGRLLWQTEVHRGGLVKKGNQKASHASSSVACDGERLFVNFLNRDAVHTSALSRDGKLLWQTKISDYVVHQGYGSSPAVYRSLVIASADNKGGGAVAGLDRKTGDVVWRRDRPKTPNYASPILLHIDGRDQLLLTGCDLVTSLDPLTGKTLWEITAATTECVTSTVTDGQRIFTSGGYPRNHVAAIEADGSGKVAWENDVRVYVPSLLIRDGRLYGVTDSGVAMCWDSATGKTLWKGRLGGTFSASPVLAGDRIYATNEAGTTFVYRADPTEFQLLAESHWGDEVFAMPVICGDRIYLRAAHNKKDQRQETLTCIAEPSNANDSD